MSLVLVRQVLPQTALAGCQAIPIPVERRTLARRIWRSRSADGREFGFELEQPLFHGDLVHIESSQAYVIAQQPEPVIEILLAGDAKASAQLGWTLGNLHQPVEVREDRILLADDPALRNLLSRLQLRLRLTQEVFQPFRPIGGLGSHSHGGLEHSHAGGALLHGHAPEPARYAAP